MLATNKTKLVCTIGPATNTPAMMRRLLDAGMNIARLNYSHSDPAHHKSVIENLRNTAQSAGKSLTILADLPGPKIRIGRFINDQIELARGQQFCLTTEEVAGNSERVHVNLTRLPQVVKAGDVIFLSDGLIHLEVANVSGHDVNCVVRAGGELRSNKGLNLPGIRLGVSAFTDRDRDCLKSALENGVDAVSQSFVERASDLQSLRQAAEEWGYRPFVIAKIERAGALEHIDEILDAADGIMIARGDLGVEIPIEKIAIVQKQLTRKANRLGKPVITATQMLVSMVSHSRPTRAETTDVANAILDGTDCVMLSEESAMGEFPIESVQMLARIATATEPYRHNRILHETEDNNRVEFPLTDLISHSVREAAERLAPSAIFVSTATGLSARMISRFKLSSWIAAISPEASTCQALQFSYGVYPVHRTSVPSDWKAFAIEWLESNHIPLGLVLLTEGPSPKHPEANHRLEVMSLSSGVPAATGA